MAAGKILLIFGLVVALTAAHAAACTCSDDCPRFKPYCIGGVCRCSAAASPNTVDHANCLACSHDCSCPRDVYNKCINGFCGRYLIDPTPTVTVTATATITRLVLPGTAVAP